MKNVDLPLLGDQLTEQKRTISTRAEAMIYAFIGSITMGLMNVVAKVLRNYTKVSAL